MFAFMPDVTTPAEPILDDTVRTVSFVSLGCPKNLVDSEKMLGLLAEDGISPVSAEAIGQDSGDDDLSRAGSEQDDSASSGRITPADAVVINTCGFLEASKNESMSVIREAVAAKQRGEVKRVVVAGCLVQRHRAKMLDWEPGIDALIGVFDRDKIVEAVRGSAGGEAVRAAQTEAPAPAYWVSGNALTKARSLEANAESAAKLTVHGKDGKGLGYFESDNARLRLTPRHYAYLRISEGCNQKCAFCTIPSIRGKMRSKAEDRVVAEARELLRDGAHELLLIGQDTTSYGDDIGAGLHTYERSRGLPLPSSATPEGDDAYRAGLPKLLRALSDTIRDEAGRGWLRLMYAYPNSFGPEMLDAFAELTQKGHLLPYLDMPLQHASDNMLAAMRRNTTREEQAAVCHALRERVPGMSLRTTFITGFPGETEDDHQQLLDFIDEVGFDAVGVFQYSPEPGTPAGTMEADSALAVPAEVKARRQAELLERQQTIAFEQAEFVAEQFDPANPENTGLRFDVLVDAPAPDRAVELEGVRGELAVHRGRTYFQAPQIDATTFVASREKLAPGELVRCVIVGSDGYDLIARPETEVLRRVSLPLA